MPTLVFRTCAVLLICLARDRYTLVPFGNVHVAVRADKRLLKRLVLRERSAHAYRQLDTRIFIEAQLSDFLAYLIETGGEQRSVEHRGQQEHKFITAVAYHPLALVQTGAHRARNAGEHRITRCVTVDIVA